MRGNPGWLSVVNRKAGCARAIANSIWFAQCTSSAAGSVINAPLAGVFNLILCTDSVYRRNQTGVVLKV
ncbi:hypothetical protein LU604_08575 [Erwinia tracheiphila]|uniref:Uncharacterized protein n=1 Tax=Erwinia tracheiphila TaxID=65700 RepID=A0A345CSJ8_9GAMM|nr:hypothetical protein [Erwinia tracheiphila]AXF76415.1 hypothetical protein AV903_10710 [Erwinia tracheiphila]UIA84923.1 hypothetical protein LU604_08575 [Erwinia tracheiphila]UIA93520.1 hypothetical protein LU632_08540 [Erwinia tracheiphila]